MVSCQMKSILQDVILGLHYFYERDVPIIHRDLSANNVLLTSDTCEHQDL